MTNILNLHLTELVEMYFNKGLLNLDKIYFVGVEQAERLMGR